MERKNNLSDDDLLQQLKKGGKDFEAASMFMFHEYQGFIASCGQKLKLNQSDLRDAYSDALVKTISKLRDGSFEGKSKISSYFYKIYYNTCVDVFRKNASNKNKPTKELLDFNARERDLVKMIETKDEAVQVVKVIESMGKSCKRILMDWGFYGYNMEEIAQRSKLSTLESARSMKYKCLKKLRFLLSKKIFNL